MAALAVLAAPPLLRAGDDSASSSYGSARLSSAAFIAGAEMRERLRQTEEQISRSLQNQISFAFRDEPLQSALRQLAGDIPLWIDEVGLTEEGVSLDEPVGGRLQNVTVDTALRMILGRLGLTFTIEHELLLITTETKASDRRRLKSFDVGPLLEQARRLNRRVTPRDRRLGRMFDETAPDWGSDHEWLPSILLDCTSGEWEEVDGVGGTVMVVGDKLLVRQTYAVLEEVQGVLEALYEAASGRLRYGSAIIRPAGYPREADERVFRALTRRVSARYTDRPLREVLVDLEQRTGIPIWIEDIALVEEGVSLDEPVTIDRQNIALHSLLIIVLREFGLTWHLDRGVLFVTTEVEAAEILQSALYDFRDLYAAGIDGTTLIEAVQDFTSGEWEEIDGGGGTAQMPFAGILLVRQTARVLDEVDGLLADLRYRSPPVAPLWFTEGVRRRRASSAASASSSSSSRSSANRTDHGSAADLLPERAISVEPGAFPNNGDQPPGAEIGSGFFSTAP